MLSKETALSSQLRARFKDLLSPPPCSLLSPFHCIHCNTMDFSRTLSYLYYWLNHISQPPMSKPKYAVRFKHLSLYYRCNMISSLTCALFSRGVCVWRGGDDCIPHCASTRGPPRRLPFQDLFITSVPASLLLVLCLGINLPHLSPFNPACPPKP